MSVAAVAVKIVETIRPDLFTYIRRRAAYIKAMRNAEKFRAAPQALKRGSITHATFPDDVCWSYPSGQSQSPWSVHGFYGRLAGRLPKRRPSLSESRILGTVAAVYHEYVCMTPEVHTLEDHNLDFSNPGRFGSVSAVVGGRL